MSSAKAKKFSLDEGTGERLVDFGTRLATMAELMAQSRDLHPVEFVLCLAPMVSQVLYRCAKKEPGAIARAADNLCMLIMEMVEVDEAERRKGCH